MLEIKNLHASVDDKQILSGLNLIDSFSLSDRSFENRGLIRGNRTDLLDYASDPILELGQFPTFLVDYRLPLR